MDPATLYALIAIGSDPPRITRRQFPSMERCEVSRSAMTIGTPGDVSILKAVCSQSEARAPDWARERVINGVPLADEYRPR